MSLLARSLLRSRRIVVVPRVWDFFPSFSRDEEKPSLPLLPSISVVPTCLSNNRQAIRLFSTDSVPKKSAVQRGREAASLGARASMQVASQGAKAGIKGAKTIGGYVKQYGPVFIGTYFGIYVTTLTTLFAGIHSGLLDPTVFINVGEHQEESMNVARLFVTYMEKYDFSRPYAPIVEKNPQLASLGLAWVVIKFTEPVRLGVTLAIVPRLARYFGTVPEAQPTTGPTEKSVQESSDATPSK